MGSSEAATGVMDEALVLAEDAVLESPGVPIGVAVGVLQGLGLHSPWVGVGVAVGDAVAVPVAVGDAVAVAVAVAVSGCSRSRCSGSSSGCGCRRCWRWRSTALAEDFHRRQRCNAVDVVAA